MERLINIVIVAAFLCVSIKTCRSAKINTPRVLLPWLPDLKVNFTFEIHEGGCYTWSLSRDDIIDLEPLYEDSWGHCSRAARVSVSKNCVPPGSVIILAEEVNTGEILRGDVDIDKITYLKVMSTTWRLYLEEAPEAFEVVAYDDQGSYGNRDVPVDGENSKSNLYEKLGRLSRLNRHLNTYKNTGLPEPVLLDNKFSTLEGVSFTWTIENVGNTVDQDPLVKLVRWRDTDYEPPRGIAELEALGQRSHSVLLYGQGIGECKVVVCLKEICTDFTLNVVASVVLTPAVATVAIGDTIRYRVVQARAGKLTVQDVSETLYYIKVPDSTALLEDNISLIRAAKIGTTSVILMSGITEVATATLTVAEPHSIRVSIRPADLVIRGEQFIIHSIVYDKSGHAMTAGNELLIRLTVEGEADVDLISSTENGTITDAVANSVGQMVVTARLHSIGGRIVSQKVEGQTTGMAVEPLEIVPRELYIAWTDDVLNIPLRHRGGGDEIVTWSDIDATPQNLVTLSSTGLVTLRGIGELAVRVQLKKYPYVQDFGRVYSLYPEMLQVASSGHARVGRPHYLHIALTAAHPLHGDLFNFNECNCESFTLSLIDGPEPQNVTAATWIEPIEGACCVIQAVWESRGISTIKVWRGRMGGAARVAVRAAPKVVWPVNAAALLGATLPVLAEGESLSLQSSDTRVVELSERDGPAPYRYPDIQLYTIKCRRKGDSRIELISQTEDERESVELEAACAPYVSRIRLEPSETPGNCSGTTKVWLRPGEDVVLRVTLLDAIGRELLDERGPKVTWDIEPYHVGIQYKASDRLFLETVAEFTPVPVPYKYYQLITAEEQAIGWTGTLKASMPEATATIQAKVVAPLTVEPLKVNLAWEGDTISNVVSITGGSGRYAVESPAGVSGSVLEGSMGISVPGPGSYDVYVTDLCVRERQLVEVHIEEVLSVEVSTSRAVCVGGCVPISALVMGVSHRYLSTSGSPDWRVTGNVEVRDGNICGLQEGAGRVRAGFGGVWSPEVEILVFPPLQISPQKARIPPGARMQLRHIGGPPPHLASLTYNVVGGSSHVEVSPSGSLHGVSLGTARIRLVALDIVNVQMASAESEVEVIPISGLHVRSATQTLLVGSPVPIWVEAVGLTAPSLAALQPPPKVTFSVRDPTSARIYTTHIDDKLERSISEGLSVRVVPLKPGLVTVDVRVRNMGQVAETRSWDSTIEILTISDIRTAIEGHPSEISSNNRLAVALGSSIRLKSLPKSEYKSYGDAFEVSPNGELRALKPGHGVIIAVHNDERNSVYRESVVHVEVSVPHYCTAEPSDDDGVRVVLRNSVGRELVAPDANVSVTSPHAHTRKSAQGTVLMLAGVEPPGAFVTFQGSAGGATVSDEVWLASSADDQDTIIATGGWAICLEGIGWLTPPGVVAYEGSGVTLAVLTKDMAARHVLRLPRAANTYTVHQIPLQKMEFLAGEWPSAMVPLSIEAGSITTGPLICAEDQKYALDGVSVQLPFKCRTRMPHSAESVLDINNGQIGCSIIPAHTITEASETELCAEWEPYRTCTKVLLLPAVQISTVRISMTDPSFTVFGHPQALKAVKMSTSPGIKIELNIKETEIKVMVKSDATCGTGWINVNSKLTMQEFVVEVDRDCQSTCSTLLEFLLSLIRPYVSTIVTVVLVGAGMMFVNTKYQQKKNAALREENQSVLPPETTPTLNRTRTWARSPYATNGPVTPVYGDASVLPDTSFSPNTSRAHSRFL